VLTETLTSPPVSRSRVPPKLLDDIGAGRCVAFVGAGFSAPAVKPWPALLKELAEHEAVTPDLRAYIDSRLKDERADRYEEVAQLLHDRLGEVTFVAELKRHLTPESQSDKVREEMAERRRLLDGIPFQTVLTTNFDTVLRGELPEPATISQVLRGYTARISASTASPHWAAEPDRSAGVVKLHGDLDRPESVVFSRLGYRKRLYGDPAYLGFLRSVFLYNTVLYIGFSFTDTYLNELRSEALAMLGSGAESPPIAYALINDVPELTREHFRRHEGIEILTYDTNGGRDFSGFREILDEIHRETNPVLRFGRLLEGKRILWIDRNPENNTPATKGLLIDAARVAGNPGAEVVEVRTVDEGVEMLRQAQANEGPPFDLVISHWGSEWNAAEQLLREIRRREFEVPALIFAAKQEEGDRKWKAQALGAQGYYYSWAGLRRGIEQVFDSGVETG
jgi:hypothetical protein